MEILPFDILAILFVIGLIAGFVDSIAGGGGLLAIPALLWAGLPPVQALATTKFQGSFGTLSATVHFLRKGHVSLRDMIPAIIFTAIGAIAGTIAVQMIDATILQGVIPVLLVIVAGYFLFSPRVGDVDAHRRMGIGAFSLVFGLTLGFYDGFFGPGTGSFWAIAYVALLGFNMIKATAHTKIVNFTSNVTSLLVFGLAGHIVWSAGLVMAVGQIIGAQIGSRTVIAWGGRVVRPLLVVVSLSITAKLIRDNPDNPIYRAFEAVFELFAG
ncbi:MAG: TSUP family transporter [Rhodospirillales bacterium]|nr:TSUP family transporter [Rhodospirillales bacterium]